MTVGSSNSRMRFGCGIIAPAALSIVMRPSGAGADGLEFPPSADFTILSGDGSTVIGNSHYRLSSTGKGTYVLFEEDHFLDGQHDIERDTLDASDSQKLPVLITYEHKYFDIDSSLERVAKADFRTGEASCTVYRKGQAQESGSKFDFPADTYAGSTVLIPLAHYLREGVKGPIRMHNFNCVPGPKLLSIKADLQPLALWEHYPGQLAEVRLKADFRWLNLLIVPFVPAPSLPRS